MLRIFVVALFALTFKTYHVAGQCNILFIDQGKGLISEVVSTYMNGRIFNTLTAAGHTVTREIPTFPIPATLPTSIDPNVYDQVWIFGTWAGENGVNSQNTNALLSIVNPYLAAGGTVYAASENGGDNRYLIQSLINANVINGSSIDYESRFFNNGGAATRTADNAEVCGVVQPRLEFVSNAVSEFQNVPAKNRFIVADGPCGNAGTPPVSNGDVVGVHFGACDMVTGRGALISIGDMNVFINRVSCLQGSMYGSGTANSGLINRIANTLSASAVCLEDPNKLTDITFCAGETIPKYVFKDSLPGINFTWTNSDPRIGLSANGNDSIDSFVATNNTGGILTAEILVSATSKNCGCPIPNDTFYITVHPEIIVDAGPDTSICSGLPVQIGGNPTVSGGSSPYTYNWAPITSLDDPTIANPLVSPSAVALTVYTVEVEDQFGCTASDDILVSNNTDAAIDPPGGPYCENDPAFNLTAGTAGGVWSGQGITETVIGTFDPAIAGPGTHEIKYTISGGCVSVGNATIIVEPIDNPTINNAGPFCESDVEAILVSNIPGGNWTGTGITNPTGGNFDPSTAGVGVHTISYTTNGNCPNTVDQGIEVLEVPTISFTVDENEACLEPPKIFEFTNTSFGGSPGDFTWDFGDGNTGSTGATATHQFTATGTYDITLTYTNAACTITHTEASMVSVHPNPNAAFTVSENSIFTYNTVVNFTDQSTQNIVSWQWEFPEGGTSNDQNPTHNFPEVPGIYEVNLVVTDANNCKDSTMGIIGVESDVSVFVPNTFTPDANDLNEVFTPQFSEPIDNESFEFLVFNRWGEIIFSTQKIEDGWNGNFNDQPSKSDVYVWKVTYKELASSAVETLTGHVTLLR